ncbi:cyclophilin-like fold protein [Vibrio antiquarius]
MVKIRFIFDDCSVSGTLKSSASTDDFVRQLPLTLDLQDYANTEKIAYLPNKLTREGAPSGTQSKAGDISYYAPWGNLVIFYKDFGYASGLIKLGQIDDGIYCFISKETNRVTIEKVN